MLVVEASCLPGSGALTLTGRQGEVMQESARTALAWLRANAVRCGLDPDFHRHTDVHLHVQSAAVPKEGASAGATMAAALVSAFTGRPVRAGVAMSGEITLAGQVLGVAGIAAKVLAAHRGGLARILLPRPDRKQVDEELGDELRRAVEVDYVTRIDELLGLALRAPAGPGTSLRRRAHRFRRPNARRAGRRERSDTVARHRCHVPRTRRTGLARGAPLQSASLPQSAPTARVRHRCRARRHALPRTEATAHRQLALASDALEQVVARTLLRNVLRTVFAKYSHSKPSPQTPGSNNLRPDVRDT